MSIQTLNITKSGTGTGTVISDVGIPAVDCGSTCSVSQTSGTQVTLTAIPDPGSKFVRWTGDIPTTSSNPVTYTQTLNPTNINAEFTKNRGTKPGASADVVCFPAFRFNARPDVIRYKRSIYYFYKTDGINYCFVKNKNQRSIIGLGTIS